MAKYHFNLEDGQSYPDTEGSDWDNLDSVRTEAVRRSGQLLQEQAQTFWGGHGWKLTVTDATGMVMFTLHFHAVSSPATENYRGPGLPTALGLLADKEQ